MIKWNEINHYGVGFIEKCVAEFNIWDKDITPYIRYKIKIYEQENGTYKGITNLMVKDEEGCPFPGIGHGETIDEALKDTIEYFYSIIREEQRDKDDEFEMMDLDLF